MDFVFTVCDNAAGEACPFWPGQPMTAHWGIEDPAAVEGTDIEKERAFVTAFRYLRNRISSFTALPIASLDRCRFPASWPRSAVARARRLRPKSPLVLEPGSYMSVFERYLTLWVALCIVVGIALGHFFPGVFQAIGAAEIAKVNLPVAVLIWLMIVPMLVKIDFAALSQVAEHWRGIGVTLFVNWAVKPFSMALLGWLFIGWLFKRWLPADQIDSYIAGLILLAAAPCTAMVFVWSNLSRRRAAFHLEPGRAQRRDHGRRLRADRRPAARLVRDHRAVVDAAAVGRALHRRARHRRADPAPGGAGVRRRGGAARRCSAACSRCRWWRC